MHEIQKRKLKDFLRTLNKHKDKREGKFITSQFKVIYEKLKKIKEMATTFQIQADA